MRVVSYNGDLDDIASHKVLAVAQWIVHMPPKRGIQVRFLSAGPIIWQGAYAFAAGNVLPP